MSAAPAPEPAAHADAYGLAARRGALALVSAVLDDGRSLDAAKADAAFTALAPPDRARAGDLAAAALRWLRPLDAVLAGLMRKPIAPRARVARDALRLAAAEVGALGVPPHAAVDAAVRLVKADRASRPLAGLVNAVARRAAEAAPQALAADDAPLQAAPDWLAARLTKAWGAREAAALAAAQMRQAALDVTPREAGAAADLARALGGAVTPSGSVRLTRRAALSTLPGFCDGAWWVQDAAAALPARLLGPVAGQTVVDLCAAPGGKTMQLAAAGAAVTAVDVSAARMARLRENLARTRLQAEIVIADAAEWRPAAQADAVLLDAPCTATGTLRRHPDIMHLRREGDVAVMAALQDRLLDAAWAMLRPGGRLVFCTCSALPEEGEARLRAFLRRAPDAALTPVAAADVGDAALIDGQGRLRCLPHHWPDGLDGFFAARLDKAV